MTVTIFFTHLPMATMPMRILYHNPPIAPTLQRQNKDIIGTNCYDIKGRRYLKTNAKYYVADTGLRRILLGDKRTDSGHLLENVIYIELRRRYSDVYVGVLGNKEVDFVAIADGAPSYFQVAPNGI